LKKIRNILVSIIMGSDSDLSVMKDAAETLHFFGVDYEIKVISAHRTTAMMIAYANEAKTRGLQVIIAGAGGSAHLPGMVASIAYIPVIGVPIKTRYVDGLDSLLSIVQMPPGVPVATVAINGAKNAAILACQILGIKHAKLSKKIAKYKKELGQQVIEKSKRLEKVGYKKYLSNGWDR
jgi:5-(carboxyamino)imidazole ribonucleotide mutase